MAPCEISRVTQLISIFKWLSGGFPWIHRFGTAFQVQLYNGHQFSFLWFITSATTLSESHWQRLPSEKKDWRHFWSNEHNRQCRGLDPHGLNNIFMRTVHCCKSISDSKVHKCCLKFKWIFLASFIQFNFQTSMRNKPLDIPEFTLCFIETPLIATDFLASHKSQTK